MPYYEIIFENGEHSIMFADNDAECLLGVGEQHRRAKAGELGAQPLSPSNSPATHSAQRIKRVLKYDTHPADFNVVVTVDDVRAAVDAVAIGDLVSAEQAAAAIRDLRSPLVMSSPHDSNYKQVESAELASTLWGGDE